MQNVSFFLPYDCDDGFNFYPTLKNTLGGGGATGSIAREFHTVLPIITKKQKV